MTDNSFAEELGRFVGAGGVAQAAAAGGVASPYLMPSISEHAVRRAADDVFVKLGPLPEGVVAQRRWMNQATAELLRLSVERADDPHLAFAPAVAWDDLWRFAQAYADELRQKAAQETQRIEQEAARIEQEAAQETQRIEQEGARRRAKEDHQAREYQDQAEREQAERVLRFGLRGGVTIIGGGLVLDSAWAKQRREQKNGVWWSYAAAAGVAIVVWKLSEYVPTLMYKAASQSVAQARGFRQGLPWKGSVENS